MAKTLFHQFISASLLSLSILFTELQSSSAIVYNPTATVEYRAVDELNAVGDGQTPDQPFQLCLTCHCCAVGDPTACLSMPCCFGIDCDLPNKPYGVCAFAPNSCNCTSCS
ncbi:hypothetical protein IEQ34_016924 [Dendrobium chrysotoxum]|uniref:DUF7866 domain-containing protein n=1 Tax=Dendrobium chrysotoxum TaxID=161865 RepID=A0AAV7GGX7_DENCH|nr:hypothetical protein IEQ34_016924 [Dendrobium chrysotoxum]